ncbi:alpha/beta hydrolase family esterase [Aquabacterium sp.]|uniref:alpha/beta hydrolase family esterase n=1 Tax=Aquabacterium sp. TaxID=1872578 RepID=UPI002CB45D9B|nr:hypothetical protein [Aquabacterium sp.]HSW05269.1 hypothetical protein [Aquabacterium sp.]
MTERSLQIALSMLFAGVLAACGSGSSEPSVPSPAPPPVPSPPPPPPPPPPASDTLSTIKLPGFPHTIDVYAAAGATRAIVFLHGGAGNSCHMANSIGLNSGTCPATVTTINWAWLAANHVLALFPQGQTFSTTQAPNGFTWSNHAMNSGQDDVAFLQTLSAYIRTQYGMTSVSLVGYSMGGTMANRMWCESPNTFNAYVAIAGPASHYYTDPNTPCLPTRTMPYMGIIGSADPIMQNFNAQGSLWAADLWTLNPVLTLSPSFLDPRVIGEWVQHGRRSSLRCGETPALNGGVVNGAVETWSNCGGDIIERLVDGADHSIASIERFTTTPLRDSIAAFTQGR